MQKATQKERKVYDTVYGFISFPIKIWKFIDTEQFQRLRQIKQLGSLSYVFPGATHTRFQHSLGTGYLARRYVQILIKNHKELYQEDGAEQQALFTLTLAGLMHDLGHGPFSHTFDSYIGQIQIIDPITNEKQKSQQWRHQLASEYLFDLLIQNNKDVVQISKYHQQRVKNLIRGTYSQKFKRRWQFELISNDLNTGIDVDKFDYFRRDAFFLGAKNIYIDHELLMQQSRIIKERICYPTKYAQKVHEIFHSRYKLYKDYYFNSVAKGIQFMISDIFDCIGKQYFHNICSKIKTKPELYRGLTDNILQLVVIKQGQKMQKGRELLKRLAQRKIYKFVKQNHSYLLEGLESEQKVRKSFNKEQILDFMMKYMENNEQAKGITKDSLCLFVKDVTFGMKDQNPFRKVAFFRKQLSELKQQFQTERYSLLFTKALIEVTMKLYLKQHGDKFDIVLEAFNTYCKLFEHLKPGQLGTPERIPAKSFENYQQQKNRQNKKKEPTLLK